MHNMSQKENMKIKINYELLNSSTKTSGTRCPPLIILCYFLCRVWHHKDLLQLAVSVCLYGLSSTHASRQTTNAGCMADILQHSRVMSYAFYQFRSFLLFLSFGVFLVDVNHKDMRLSCESELLLAPTVQ